MAHRVQNDRNCRIGRYRFKALVNVKEFNSDGESGCCLLGLGFKDQKSERFKIHGVGCRAEALCQAFRVS